jgi:16S rRNA processing protein RimM
MRVEYVVVGRVVSAHGIHGRVIVEPLTDNPDRFASGSVLCIEGEGEKMEREVTVGNAMPYKGRLLVALSGVTERGAAEELRGKYLCVPFEDLPEPGEEEYYHHQLVGLEAIDGSGDLLGVVRSLVSMPAQDVLVIERDGSEHMVPFVAEFVKRVDLERGVIIIADMPGLFERE